MTTQVTDGNGNQSALARELVTVDTSVPLPPVIRGPAFGTTVASAEPSITGTGEPEDVLAVTIDGNEVGTTTVAVNGVWTYSPTAPLVDGVHEVTAIQTNDVGIVSAPSAVDTFTIDTSTGTASGDVHMVTYDGLHYDFQADGTFILTRSTNPADGFQIQIQTNPYPLNNAASITTAIAAQVGSDVLTFAIGRPDVAWLNGIPDTALGLSDPVQTFAAGKIVEISPGDFEVDWNSGQSFTIADRGTYFDMSVKLGAANGPGSAQGLLGSDSGQGNDFQLPDGTVLQQPLTPDEILGPYAKAWSVTPGTSLFGEAASVNGGQSAEHLFGNLANGSFHTSLGAQGGTKIGFL